MTLQLLTANRLQDGEVVYLTETGAWSERIQDAATRLDDKDQESLLATGEAAEKSCLVVGPYLMAVAAEGDRLLPLSQRERIRALGPSTRHDLGKQAAQGGTSHVSL